MLASRRAIWCARGRCPSRTPRPLFRARYRYNRPPNPRLRCCVRGRAPRHPCGHQCSARASRGSRPTGVCCLHRRSRGMHMCRGPGYCPCSYLPSRKGYASRRRSSQYIRRRGRPCGGPGKDLLPSLHRLSTVARPFGWHFDLRPRFKMASLWLATASALAFGTLQSVAYDNSRSDNVRTTSLTLDSYCLQFPIF